MCDQLMYYTQVLQQLHQQEYENEQGIPRPSMENTSRRQCERTNRKEAEPNLSIMGMGMASADGVLPAKQL